MDCKDLMVGDWVEQIQDFVSFAPTQIEEVRKDCVVFSNGVCHLRYDEIRPIPLTEGILVKNGFERCDYNNKYFIIDDVIDLITPKWRGGTEYYACAWYQDEFGDLVQHIEICKCAYVHQLQRLIKLCNIDKEITL